MSDSQGVNYVFVDMRDMKLIVVVCILKLRLYRRFGLMV